MSDKVFFQIPTFFCKCLRNVPKSKIKGLFKTNGRKKIFILEPNLKLFFVLRLFRHQYLHDGSAWLSEISTLMPANVT